jgi:gluconate kinase
MRWLRPPQLAAGLLRFVRPLVRRFVIVSGLPASGKSTVGQAIASGLGLPFLDKDNLLEPLFERTPTTDEQGRNELSRLADASFRERALSAEGGVLVSWWKHPRSLAASGTPTQWLSFLHGTLVEVHCVCAAPIAVERFLARKRHFGHLDGRHLRSQLLVQFNRQQSLGPLGVGSLVQVGTDGTVEMGALLHKINVTFESSRRAHPAV